MKEGWSGFAAGAQVGTNAKRYMGKIETVERKSE